MFKRSWVRIPAPYTRLTFFKKNVLTRKSYRPTATAPLSQAPPRLSWSSAGNVRTKMSEARATRRRRWRRWITTDHWTTFRRRQRRRVFKMTPLRGPQTQEMLKGRYTFRTTTFKLILLYSLRCSPVRPDLAKLCHFWIFNYLEYIFGSELNILKLLWRNFVQLGTFALVQCKILIFARILKNPLVVKVGLSEFSNGHTCTC